MFCAGTEYEATVLSVPPKVFFGKAGITDAGVFMAFSKDASYQDNGALKEFPSRGRYTGLAQRAVEPVTVPQQPGFYSTMTTPQLNCIDAYYYRFLRRIIGIKASYYSRVPNHSVWRQAGYPKLPSTQLNNIQRKMMDEGLLLP